MTEPRISHDVIVTFYGALGEYLPHCSCGWTGSYATSSRRAHKEVGQHIESHHYEFIPGGDDAQSGVTSDT